jgi:hypothetical protein
MKTLFSKRILTKISIWFKRKFNHIEQLSNTERAAVYIFTTLSKDHNSELYANPYNEKYYIKSLTTGIFVTITKHHPEISIINHVYGYTIKLSNRTIDSMVKTFLIEVDKRRLQMENEYKSNIEHSISNIAKTIKEKL